MANFGVAAVLSYAVLAAIGNMPDGKRSIPGVGVLLAEAEVHWRGLLAGLVVRGMCGVRFVVSDNHPGLKRALQTRLARVP